MIARLWRGVADASNADAYQRHATATVLPALREIPGHHGAYLLRRVTGARTEFLVVTLWESIDAIRAFAGADAAKAVVEPEARAVLAEFDNVAQHYEIAYDGLNARPAASPARARSRGA